MEDKVIMRREEYDALVVKANGVPYKRYYDGYAQYFTTEGITQELLERIEELKRLSIPKLGPDFAEMSLLGFLKWKRSKR